MNKILKGALALALIAGTTGAATNKTFLMPRSHGVNLAMEYTTWNELLQTKDEDRFGANFQITGFYSQSTNQSDIGKYFGVKDKNILDLRTTAANADVIGTYIIHDVAQAGAANAIAKIKLEPEQKAYGVRIDYYQDLEKILKGLYLKVALPVVHVENDVQLTVFGEADAATKADIISYFKGTYEGAKNQANDNGAKLTHAKVDGARNTTGVADIDFVLGYKFLDKEKYHMSINLGLTIPVGDEADGVYMFEPIVGNGNHWAFGGGLDFGVKLWDDEDQNIKINAALNYRYLFEGTEKRTLGIKDRNFGQYYLLGKGGTPINDQQFEPAANLLTRNVDVEPGSQLDAILGLAYNNGGFSLDIGYNLFWKDSEDVSLKDDPFATDAYGIVLRTLDPQLAANFVPTNAAHADGGQLAKANIDTAAAASPSQTTHKIYGGMGYIFKNWDYPLMLGLGGGYEFANSDALENWSLWGKLGIAF